jgi:signal transduction histidine kinase/CheY-like chemotaxis protein
MIGTKLRKTSVDLALRERLLTTNYQTLPLVLVPTPIIAAVMAWPLLGSIPWTRVLIWLAGLLALASVGLLVRRAYFRRDPGDSLGFWAGLRVGTAVLNGLGWGLYAALFLWVEGRFDLKLYVSLLISLTCVGALVSSGVFFPAFVAYTSCCITPLVVRLLLEGDAVSVAASIELCLLMIVVLAGGYASARRGREQHQLMFEKEELVAELRVAEEELLDANRLLNQRVDESTQELATAIDERHKSELGLARAQKMEAIGRLAGGVAHDFNNVLTGIMGSASFLADSLPNSSREQREEIEEIVKGADRAARLTAQLLSLARGGFSRPTQIDVNRRLQQLAHLMRRALGEANHLEVVPADALCVVFMDPTQFDQLVMNLVLNAKDASRPGQSIVVTVEREAPSSKEARVNMAADVMTLRVRDEGSGMPSDVKDRIFEPFFTTKGERGTGLGLSTCFGIVERAGGSIGVESEPARGSTFTVRLPVVDDEPASETTRTLLAPTRVSLRNVLVVEDQETVLRVVSRTLARMGNARVHEARSAEEALGLFERGLPDLDLIISDVLLPKQTGPELIRELRARGYAGPCLLVSGYVEDAALVDRPTGARLPLLPKPFTATELTEAIARVLRDRTGSARPLERGNGS